MPLRLHHIVIDAHELPSLHCTRPAELACRYETICETCSCFTSSIAFRDTLQNQHNDANARGDNHRKQVYANVLDDLNKAAS